MRYSRCFFDWNSFICVISTITLVSQGQKHELKGSADFVVVVDRSAPAIGNWTPSPNLLDTSSRTERIHDWTQRLVEGLLAESRMVKDGPLTNVDVRVVVFLLDRYNGTITKQVDLYSRDHKYGFKQYPMPPLESAYVQFHPISSADIERTIETVSNAIAAAKPVNRAKVTEIVIWHVPYDGKDPAIIDAWRQMHAPIADVMVALDGYWYDTMDILNLAVVIVSEPLAEAAYTLRLLLNPYYFPPPKPLIKAVSNVFYSCYAKVISVPCYYKEGGTCDMEKSYIPQENNTALSKYCRNGTEVMDCGRSECDEQCTRAGMYDPCNTTCGIGTMKRRPEAPINEYTKHCPWFITCYKKPCEYEYPAATENTFLSIPLLIAVMVIAALVVVAAFVSTTWYICQLVTKPRLNRQLTPADLYQYGHGHQGSMPPYGGGGWRYPPPSTSMPMPLPFQSHIASGVGAPLNVSGVRPADGPINTSGVGAPLKISGVRPADGPINTSGVGAPLNISGVRPSDGPINTSGVGAPLNISGVRPADGPINTSGVGAPLKISGVRPADGPINTSGVGAPLNISGVRPSDGPINTSGVGAPLNISGVRPADGPINTSGVGASLNVSGARATEPPRGPKAKQSPSGGKTN